MKEEEEEEEGGGGGGGGEGEEEEGSGDGGAVSGVRGLQGAIPIRGGSAGSCRAHWPCKFPRIDSTCNVCCHSSTSSIFAVCTNLLKCLMKKMLLSVHCENDLSVGHV